MSTQRVSHEEVRAIFPTDMVLQPYIETATLIVTERLVGHYSDARLTEIERWLTAHLASMSVSSTGGSTTGGGQVSSVKADEISVTYAVGKLGEGLASSRFGEHVNLLDYKGLLGQDMRSIPASFFVH